MKKRSNGNVTDLTYLKKVSNGDNDFIKEMIVVYLRETPEALNNLENYLKNKDWKKFKEIIHKMKPSFSFFGLKKLYTTIDSMEEYSDKEIHLDLLPEMIAKVKLTCTKAMAELKDIISHVIE
jgi:HPt (histidine-containing phosphotransfer) domain-containing protein